MGGASNNNGGGGGSPGQQAKDKAAKAKAVKAKEDRQAKIRADQKTNDSLIGGSDYQGDVNPQKKPKNQTPTPKDNNNKTVVPKPKPTVPKKDADYNLEKDDTGVKESIEAAKKKKPLIIIPKDNNSGTETKPIVAPKPTPPPPATTVTPPPTKAEVDQGTSTMMSDAEISIKNKKKGRSTTILTGATGLGNSSVRTTKRTLGA